MRRSGTPSAGPPRLKVGCDGGAGCADTREVADVRSASIPSGFTPSGFTPPGFTPPGFTPPGSTPPGSTPPVFTPPVFTPPGFTPPGFTPPVDPPRNSSPPDFTAPGPTRSRSLTESILQRIASGDAAAVTECMDRFGGLVWSVARRYCASTADAEDAVQEIFIDLWRSAARFDETIASETTFVAMIARRRLIDRNRKKARRPETSMVPETLAIAAPGEIDEEIAVNSEEARIAQEALGQLRPEQQRVLQLSIFHGASHEQISRSTGLPLGTVKTHARRGLIRIRELLESRRREQDTSGTATLDGPGGAR